MKRSDARNFESVFPAGINGMASIPQGKRNRFSSYLVHQNCALAKVNEAGPNGTECIDPKAIHLKEYINMHASMHGQSTDEV